MNAWRALKSATVRFQPQSIVGKIEGKDNLLMQKNI